MALDTSKRYSIVFDTYNINSKNLTHIAKFVVETKLGCEFSVRCIIGVFLFIEGKNKEYVTEWLSKTKFERPDLPYLFKAENILAEVIKRKNILINRMADRNAEIKFTIRRFGVDCLITAKKEFTLLGFVAENQENKFYIRIVE